jgi:hypothetical protein
MITNTAAAAVEVGEVEGEATANKAMMTTVKMINKAGVVEDTAGNKAGEAMDKEEEVMVVATKTKGDNITAVKRREGTASKTRVAVEDASRSKGMMAGIKVADMEGAIKVEAMAMRDARSTTGDDRKRGTASKNKATVAREAARSTTVDDMKKGTVNKNKATVAREDASKSKDMVVGTKADPMAMEATTTVPVMPSTTHNLTEAMVTKKAECSGKLCLTLVKTSKISKMRALTSNRWCRVGAAK